MPAQHGLHGRDAVLLCDGADGRILEHLRSPAERTPRLGDDAVRIVVGALLALLEVRMRFDLIDRWRHAGQARELVDVAGQEVAYADMLDDALLLRVDERLPSLEI